MYRVSRANYGISWTQLCDSGAFRFNLWPRDNAQATSGGCWRVTSKESNVCQWDIFVAEAETYAYLFVVTVGAREDAFGSQFGSALMDAGYTDMQLDCQPNDQIMAN